jgi:hypothetical protein
MGDLSLTYFPCVPLQIMDGCLQFFLRTHHPFASPMVMTIIREPILWVKTATWLPSIMKPLPHAWILEESLITEKTVKHNKGTTVSMLI